MIVTIDGPAGSGKSTAARRLAERLGFQFLDTGAMYRAVALAFLFRSLNEKDEAAVAAALPELHIELPRGRVVLNGQDVSTLIRTPEAGQGASRVAVIPAVRLHLAAEQRRIAAGGNFVCEGRDQGTFVFPDAGCKFFLTADPQARAERRHRELAAKGEAVSLEGILKSQAERDARDAERDLAPMKPAADAILVDTTHLDEAAVVDRLYAEVARRCSTAPR
jgi:cytidylate kinase